MGLGGPVVLLTTWYPASVSAGFRGYGIWFRRPADLFRRPPRDETNRRPHSRRGDPGSGSKTVWK